jgi:hypothetical protein
VFYRFPKEGISTDNTTLALGPVSANDFCIQGTNKSDTSLVIHYQKSVDDILPGACRAA